MRGLQQAAALLCWAVYPTISCNNLATCPSELGGVAFPEAFRKRKALQMRTPVVHPYKFSSLKASTILSFFSLELACSMVMKTITNTPATQ